MFPVLFQFGFVTIYSYGLLMAVAVLLSAYLMAKDAALHKVPKDAIYDLIFTCVLWGIIGARIFYVFLYWDYFIQEPLEILMLQKGGLAWQGGFIGGALAGILFVRQRQLPLRLILDIAAPYLALGQAIGRMGCFLNGCCYGKALAWGVYFPAHQARLHPTQLYETGGLLLVFFILKAVSKRQGRSGFVFVLYLCLMAGERFIVEFFRADHETLYFNLSLFQWIALGIFTSGLIYATKIYRR